MISKPDVGQQSAYLQQGVPVCSGQIPTATMVPLSIPCILPVSGGVFTQGVAEMAEKYVSMPSLDELISLKAA